MPNNGPMFEPLDLDDILPAWVIHCPEEPDRTRDAVNHFKSIGMPFQVSYGIHGEAFGLRSVLTYGKNKHDLLTVMGERR